MYTFTQMPFLCLILTQVLNVSVTGDIFMMSPRHLHNTLEKNAIQKNVGFFFLAFFFFGFSSFFSLPQRQLIDFERGESHSLSQRT